MKIVVTAGGTMGHINPALAIIEEFKRQEKNLEILYIGTHNRMEKDIIPKLGINYLPLKIYGFSKNPFLDIKNIFLIKKAIKKCMKVMQEFKPDVVIGVGGYVTYPVVVAAHKLNIKTFIHEQNSIPGKSNKMISKYADLIGISFKKSQEYFPKDKRIIYTGHPSGVKALSAIRVNKKDLGLDEKKKLVSVVAGSLGSEAMNNKFREYLKEREDNLEIVYITGKTFYEEFKNNQFSKHVKILPYYDNLPGLLKISDLVISRAGAGSLFEILALEKPAIIIPSPYVANNHQYYNAKELSDKGCIKLLEEKNLNKETIKNSIHEILDNEEERKKMIKEMAKLDTKDSCKMIYEAIKEMVK